MTKTATENYIPLTDDNLDERVQARLNARHDELVAMIDHKIDTVIDRTINEAFRDSQYSKTGYAASAIRKLVKGEIDQQVKTVTVDRMALRAAVQKKVDAQLKKLKVNINAKIG